VSDSRASTGQAARDALVRSLVVYGVQIAVMGAVIVAMRQRPWIQHQWWRVQQARGRREASVDAAMHRMRPGLHDDIRRFEAGEG
jgi:hypothetical protein